MSDQLDIKHPADVVRLLRVWPTAYVTKSLTRNTSKAHAGGYQLIRAGEFGSGDDEYICLPIPDASFENLDEHNELTLVDGYLNRWKLK